MKADMFRLDGKVVAVIGAGCGIGEAVATGVAQQGGTTSAATSTATRPRRPPPAIRAAGRHGRERRGGHHRRGRTCDAALDARGHGRTGTLDGLVCTPAINVRKPILKYSGEEFDRWST